MVDEQWLTQQFEASRGRLRAVAYQMLGSASDAEDAVQEAWLRLHRSDAGEIDNLGAWLTTVVSRVSLDMLRSRGRRREHPLEAAPIGSVLDDVKVLDPEREAILADSVGSALLFILDSLTPVERMSYVLHDMFALSFDEIAEIVGRSPAAVRQLTSRARRRISGREPDGTIDVDRQRQVVGAFLAASREGRFGDLIALLDPDVVLRADAATVAFGAAPEVRTAVAVAETFSGRARAARPAMVDGVPGAVWSVGGVPKVVFEFTVIDDRIVGICMLSEPAALAELELDSVDG
jgi:RNA polymerase sigma factor (sigma-70 family)